MNGTDGRYNFTEDQTAGICTCCGAGLHNGNQHDPNCLINLPKHTPKLMANWRQGFEGRHFNPGLLDTQAQKRAWDMGQTLRKRNESTERTAQSLKQAVEIARSL